MNCGKTPSELAQSEHWENQEREKYSEKKHRHIQKHAIKIRLYTDFLIGTHIQTQHSNIIAIHVRKDVASLSLSNAHKHVQTHLYTHSQRHSCFAKRRQASERASWIWTRWKTRSIATGRLRKPQLTTTTNDDMSEKKTRWWTVISNTDEIFFSDVYNDVLYACVYCIIDDYMYYFELALKKTLSASLV